jgi:iron complex outermembrane receptor protein
MSSPTRQRLASRLVAFSVAAILSQPGTAAEQSRPKHFDIQSQELAAALGEFARQSDRQILFSTEVAASKRTRGIRGELEPEVALRQLLQGTDLTFRITADDTILVESATTTNTSNAYSSPRGYSRVAQVSASDFAASNSASSAASDSTQSIESSPSVDRRKPEEIVVTGSRLRNSISGPQPVITATAQDIERSGHTTIGGFLNNLTHISVSTAEVGGQGAANGVTPQLRGLPFGTTLTLLNGRRVQSAAVSGGGIANFFDLNTIPSIAVERIEIATQGSSAVYGSDALAGVVNIILKKSYDGVGISGEYAYAEGTRDETINGNFGGSWASGGASISLSYLGRSGLRGSQRELTASADYRRYGGPDLRGTACQPGNVYSIDGENLPGLPSAIAAIPGGIKGTPQINDFLAGVGYTNLCNSDNDLSLGSLIPRSNRISMFVSAYQSIFSEVELFTEILHSRTRQTTWFPSATTLQQARVPAANPYNPFGVDVLVDYKLFPDARQEYEDGFAHSVLGLRGMIGGVWDWEVAATVSRDKSHLLSRRTSPNYSAIAAAINSPNPATALNPFASEPLASSVLDTLFGSVALRSDYETRAWQVNAFVRGDLLEGWAGPLQSVFGVEATRDRFDVNGSVNYEYSRLSKSVFSELQLPLVARTIDGRAVPVLAMTGAIRYNDYNDFGSATVPQVALVGRPASNVTLRANYSESFKAPSSFQIGSPPTSFLNLTLIDRKRGDLPTPAVPIIGGGNAELGPEYGRSWSIDGTWASSASPGVRASVGFWNIEIRDQVASMGPQVFLDYEDQYPGFVTRAPTVDGEPGAVLAVRSTAVNVGSVEARGVDLDLRGEVSTAFGTLSAQASATYTDQYLFQLSAFSPLERRVGRANLTGWAPQWKARLNAGWKRNNLHAEITARYVSSYNDYNSQTIRMPSLTFYDVNAGWQLGNVLGAGEAALSVGAINILNALPDYSSAYPTQPFDPRQADIRGRYVYLRMQISW